MKKYNIIFLLTIVLSVCFFLVACNKANQSGKNPNTLIPEEVTEVTVNHILSGNESDYTIEGTALEKLKIWASNLSMKHKVYKDGSSPGDVDGGEVYSFNMGNNYTDFSYIINGENDCHILIGDEWYEVLNPTVPFDESELESSTGEQSKCDKIPMVMVEDKLYLDTGKQISVEIDNSAIIGTITSEVDATEAPSQNG